MTGAGSPQEAAVSRGAARTVRWPLAAVAVAMLIGLAVADNQSDPQGALAVLPSRQATSAAPGPDADGGVWYCSEGTSLPGEFADHSVIVANPTSEAVAAAVSVFPETELGSASPSAEPVVVLLDVPARSESSLRLAEVVASRYTAALVEVDSGLAVVEQRVQGPTGVDVAPCATRSSAVWHFAAGSTRRDARLVFTVFNPFPDRAVVRFAFSTDEGNREPQALRGVLVPARSLVVVDATDMVPRFESVATTVESLAGRVVAGRLQLFDGSEGLEGLTAGPGVPEARMQWLFPAGPADEGIAEHLFLYNPTDQEASVGVALRADGWSPEEGQPPFEVLVPPRQRVALAFAEVGEYPLPAAPFAYSAEALHPSQGGFWLGVLVYNGVPIAAERVAAAAASSSPAGVATAAGTSVVAAQHLVAGNRADGAESVLVVVNPSSDSIALISVSAIADGQITPVARLHPREVAPRGRVAVPVNRLVDPAGSAYALLVESTQPVAVSRSLLASSGTGLATGAAVSVDPVLLDPSDF